MSLPGAQRTLGGKRTEDSDLRSNDQTVSIRGWRLAKQPALSKMEASLQRKGIERALWHHPGLPLREARFGHLNLGTVSQSELCWGLQPCFCRQDHPRSKRGDSICWVQPGLTEGLPGAALTWSGLRGFSEQRKTGSH